MMGGVDLRPEVEVMFIAYFQVERSSTTELRPHSRHRHELAWAHWAPNVAANQFSCPNKEPIALLSSPKTDLCC